MNDLTDRSIRLIALMCAVIRTAALSIGRTEPLSAFSGVIETAKAYEEYIQKGEQNDEHSR